MNPNTVFSASLVTSLVLWFPSMQACLRGDLDLAPAGLRYLAALAVSRLAMNFLARLVNAYRAAQHADLRRRPPGPSRRRAEVAGRLRSRCRAAPPPQRPDQRKATPTRPRSPPDAQRKVCQPRLGSVERRAIRWASTCADAGGGQGHLELLGRLHVAVDEDREAEAERRRPIRLGSCIRCFTPPATMLTSSPTASAMSASETSSSGLHPEQEAGEVGAAGRGGQERQLQRLVLGQQRDVGTGHAGRRHVVPAEDLDAVHAERQRQLASRRRPSPPPSRRRPPRRWPGSSPEGRAAEAVSRCSPRRCCDAGRPSAVRRSRSRTMSGSPSQVQVTAVTGRAPGTERR